MSNQQANSSQAQQQVSLEESLGINLHQLQLGQISEELDTLRNSPATPVRVRSYIKICNSATVFVYYREYLLTSGSNN